MRVPIVIVALLATPFLADVSAAQSKSDPRGHGRTKNECEKPGQRKGHERTEWMAKHADRSCQRATPPDSTPVTPPDTTPVTPPKDSTPVTPRDTMPTSGGTEIHGTVYVDLDWSGVPNDGEPRLAGNTVQLLLNGAVFRTTLTNGNGAYVFAQVPIGHYIVCAVPKSGFGPATPFSGVACASGFGYETDVTPFDPNTIFDGLDFGFATTS
jgi:hypothetical protein